MQIKWKLWLKPIIMLLYAIIVCISLPFIIIEYSKKDTPNGKRAWFIGGIFVIGAVPISLWTIIEHVVHYTKPYLQRYIIRILWMVPIYALNAWFALRFQSLSIYFDTFRECYGAFVIYSFKTFLRNFLLHEYPDFGEICMLKPQVEHLLPCRCLPKYAMGLKFVNTCRLGVLQYTVIRPMTTMVAFVCEMAGVYHSNEFRFDGAYLYLNIVNNISQIWAMYSLIMFYRCMREELKSLNPISKFLCVKFVIFLSFWQSVIFFILGATGVITSVEEWKSYKPSEISAIFQNVFICVEMFLAAIAHHFSFSVNPYRIDKNDDKPKCVHSCLAMCDLSDVANETLDHVKHVARRIKTKFTSSTPGNTVGTCEPCEDTSLVHGNLSHTNVAHYLSMQDGDVAVARMANIQQHAKHSSKSDSSNDNSFEMSQISEVSLSPIITELCESTENLVNFSSFNQSNVNPALTK